MVENSSRILKWFLQLQNFDFEIVYKPGYLNCVADMLTREKLQEKPSLNMFGYGASNASNKNSKLRIFNDPLPKEEREDFLNCTNKKEYDKYLSLFLTQQVNASPLKNMERWEKQAFKGLENSMHQLQ